MLVPTSRSTPDRVAVEAEAPAAVGRAEQAPVGELGEDEGDGVGLLVVAQALEGDRAERDVLVGQRPVDAGGAGQPVGVGIVVLGEEAVVARHREVEVGIEAVAQADRADRRQGAAQRLVVLERVRRGEDARDVEAAVGEAGPVLALEQHAAFGGDEGGDGHVGRGAEGAVVGQLEAQAEDARGEEARHQNAARPLDPGLGNAQPRHVADRDAEELEAGVLEVDAPRHGVVGDARGAQRPGRRRVLGADGAGARHRAVERRVAVAAADLHRRHLQLSGDQEPRARDQAVGQVGGQRRCVGDEHAAGRVGQHQRSLGADLVGRLVVDDPPRPEHPALVEHLHVAGGGEQPGLAVVADLVGDQARRQVLAARSLGGHEGEEAGEDEARDAGTAHPQPSSRCRSRLTASRIAATGGVQAATTSGMLPLLPSDSAKSLRK